MEDKKFLKFIDIWKNDFAYFCTLKENRSSDRNGQPLPWYTYPAIEYLSQFDYSNKKIFEFGCGNSGLFWAQRASEVYSVEDKPAWFAKWRKELRHPNLKIMLRGNDQTYERAVLESGDCFDVIIIDGIRRGQCAKTALDALNPGGMIIFDDSDRANNSDDYAQGLKILKDAGLLEVDFYGFCPTNVYPKTTSVFFCRDFNFSTRGTIQPANGIGNLWSLGRKKRKEAYKMFEKEEKQPPCTDE